VIRLATVLKFDKTTLSKLADRVLQALVDRTLYVENKTALAHVLVLKDISVTHTRVADLSVS